MPTRARNPLKNLIKFPASDTIHRHCRGNDTNTQTDIHKKYEYIYKKKQTNEQKKKTLHYIRPKQNSASVPISRAGRKENRV